MKLNRVGQQGVADVREDADNVTDDTKEAPELFGLFAEDSFIVERLIKSVQTLIKRDSTTPEQIFLLAKLLHALTRLPLPTDGIGIELSLGIRHANDEMSCQEINLDAHSFRLSNFASIIVAPTVGGDAQSETIFETEVAGFRETAEPRPMAVMGWLNAFDRHIGETDQELQIADSENSSNIDCEAETNESHWNDLESNY